MSGLYEIKRKNRLQRKNYFANLLTHVTFRLSKSPTRQSTVSVLKMNRNKCWTLLTGLKSIIMNWASFIQEARAFVNTHWPHSSVCFFQKWASLYLTDGDNARTRWRRSNRNSYCTEPLTIHQTYYKVYQIVSRVDSISEADNYIGVVDAPFMCGGGARALSGDPSSLTLKLWQDCICERSFTSGWRIAYQETVEWK